MKSIIPDGLHGPIGVTQTLSVKHQGRAARLALFVCARASVASTPRGARMKWLASLIGSMLNVAAGLLNTCALAFAALAIGLTGIAPLLVFRSELLVRSDFRLVTPSLRVWRDGGFGHSALRR
jgi:hypothetical protein